MAVFPWIQIEKKRLGKNAPKTPLFTNSYSFCHIMVTIRFLLTWTQSLNLTLDLCWINRKKCNELWVVLNKEKNIITLRRSPALKPLSKIAGRKRPALVDPSHKCRQTDRRRTGPLPDHWTDTGRTSQNLRTYIRTYGRKKNVTPKDPLHINAWDLKSDCKIISHLKIF